MPEILTQQESNTTHAPLCVDLEPHRPFGISGRYETGVVANNLGLHVRQEAVAKIVAGYQDFVISRVKTDDGEGYAITLPADEAEGRGKLVAVVRDGSSIAIGRSYQPQLKEYDYLSRTHFSIQVDTDGTMGITDEGSSNGTKFIEVVDGDPAYENLSWTAKSKDVQAAIQSAEAQLQVKPLLGEFAREVVLGLENNSGVKELASNEITQMVTEAVQQSDINARILEYLKDVTPKQGIEMNGQKYAIGDIFRYANRKMLVMLVENGAGTILPRLFYKSNSDGGWRSCPGVYDDGIFSKGKDQDYGAYVWGTKPSEQLVKTLEAIEADTLTKVDIPDKDKEIDSLFRIKTLMREGVYSFENESKGHFIHQNDKQAKAIYGLVEPGVGFTTSLPPQEIRRQLDNLELPHGFTPDFTRIERSYMFDHTLLGKSRVTVHIAKSSGKDIEWHVASAMDGTVWIDKIIYSPPQLNSYGTYKDFIKGGALALKPYEHRVGTLNMQQDIDYKDVASRNYVSLRPTIDRMPWARAYRTAQNIQ